MMQAIQRRGQRPAGLRRDSHSIAIAVTPYFAPDLMGSLAWLALRRAGSIGRPIRDVEWLAEIEAPHWPHVDAGQVRAEKGVKVSPKL